MGGREVERPCTRASRPLRLERGVPQSIMWGGGEARTCGRGCWTAIPVGGVTVHVCITTATVVMHRRYRNCWCQTIGGLRLRGANGCGATCRTLRAPPPAPSALRASQRQQHANVCLLIEILGYYMWYWILQAESAARGTAHCTPGRMRDNWQPRICQLRTY